jgi:biotin carboxyl carrier protein
MRRYTVEISGEERTVEVERLDGGRVRARVDGQESWIATAADPSVLVRDDGRVARVDTAPGRGRWTLSIGGAAATATVRDSRRSRAGRRSGSSGNGAIEAPMPGRVIRVAVVAGQRVAAGQALVVVEAMKMENELRAGVAGTVRDVAVREGQAVEAGERLLTVDP